jgi:hypothetical protein
MIKYIGDKTKDFFMGLTHREAGMVVLATIVFMVAAFLA